MACRILHVITGLSTGGAETMLFKLLSAMQSGDCESVVISLTDAGSYGPRIEALGVPVHVLGMSPGRPTLKALRMLRSLITSISPDVIQGWMYHANLAASLANIFRLAAVPVVWNIRQSLDHYATEKPSTRKVIQLGAYLSAMPKRIIYNSRHSAVQHAAAGYRKNRELIIPNGFDCEVFRPSTQHRREIRDQLGIDENTVLIGMVGRYHPMKDHENFLRAAAITSTRHDQVVFLLVGHGLDADNRELMQMVEHFGLARHLFLLGERKDIPAITASLDIAALSSSSEAFPNVVGEAMACGLPCVVTRVGDAEWILDDAGLVVPVSNAQALADAWSKMIDVGSAERQRLGTLGRQRILEYFSIDKVALQYQELYAALARNIL